MRVFCSFCAAAIFSCVITGCSSSVATTTSMERQQRYARLAIVCAASGEANSAYGPIILERVNSRIFPLKFLEKAECLPDVPVDISTSPPVVQLEDTNDYDAVVALVYSYGEGHVYLDCYMTDTATGEQIWQHTFDAPDPDIKQRLCSQGRFVPAIIKKRFYGL